MAISQETIAKLKSYDPNKATEVGKKLMTDFGFSEQDSSQVTASFFYSGGVFGKDTFIYAPGVVRGAFQFGDRYTPTKVEFLLNVKTGAMLVGDARHALHLDPTNKKVTIDNVAAEPTSLEEALKKVRYQELDLHTMTLRVKRVAFTKDPDSGKTLTCVRGYSTGSTSFDSTIRICSETGPDKPSLTKEEVSALTLGRGIRERKIGDKKETTVLDIDPKVLLKIPLTELAPRMIPKLSYEFLLPDGLDFERLKKLAGQGKLLEPK